MKNNYDELINKYLDNELELPELQNVNELIKTDSEFNIKLSTQKYVHQSLYELPVFSAPLGITEKIMNRLASKLSSKYQKNYFFRGIVASLMLILTAVLFMFFFFAQDLQFIQEAPSVTDLVQNYTSPVITTLYSFLTSELFRTISGITGFIILLSFYFTLNSFKEFKDRIKHF